MNPKKNIFIVSLTLIICIIFFFIIFRAQSGVLLWIKGDRMMYSSELKMKTVFETGTLMQNSPRQENYLIYKTKLMFKIISVSDSSVFIKGMPHLFVIETKGINNPVDFHNLPFLLELNPNGNIRKIFYSILLSKDKKELLDSILYNYQFTFYPEKEEWSAVEQVSDAINEIFYTFKKSDNLIVRKILNTKNNKCGNPVFSRTAARINKAFGSIILSNKHSWFSSINTAFNTERKALLKQNKKKTQK